MIVCIIGSGLSALTLAKALVNQKISVDMVFSKKKNKIDRSRTIGISKSNFEYFNNNIININKIIWKLKKIDIYSDNIKNEKILNFEDKQDQLFSIVKNYKLYEYLFNSLSNDKYYKIINPRKMSTKYDNYNLIINCDPFSYFTKTFFSKKIVKTYNSLAYTTIINHEKILNDSAIQIFTKKGPLAFLPISKNKTSIVYSIHNSKSFKNENINKLINQYNFKYKILKIEKIKSFDLKSFVLRSYFHNNILAFGDLLHTLHPLAGQGFNMTIRDIIILNNIIKEKTELGLPLDLSVNKDFEKKLKHKNYIFLNSIDLIHEFFNFDRKIKSSILSNSVKILGKNSFINRMFTQIADKGINF